MIPVIKTIGLYINLSRVACITSSGGDTSDFHLDYAALGFVSLPIDSRHYLPIEFVSNEYLTTLSQKWIRYEIIEQGLSKVCYCSAESLFFVSTKLKRFAFVKGNKMVVVESDLTNTKEIFNELTQFEDQ